MRFLAHLPFQLHEVAWSISTSLDGMLAYHVLLLFLSSSSLMITSLKPTCALLTNVHIAIYVAEPSKAPVLTGIKVINSTSIEVEWEPVPQEFRHGIITKYVILYTVEKENKTGTKDVLQASLLKTVLNGLRQSSAYSIRVLAATMKGNGPAGEPKSGTTAG